MPRKESYLNAKADALLTPSQREATAKRYTAYVSELKAKRRAVRLAKHAEYVRQRRLEEPEKCRAMTKKAKETTKARRLADPEFDAVYRAKRRAIASAPEKKAKKRANRIALESTPEWQAKEILRRSTPEWQAQEKLRRAVQQEKKRAQPRIAKPSITKVCPWCSQEFTTTNARQIYCKRQCGHGVHKSRSKGRGGVRIRTAEWLSEAASLERRRAKARRKQKTPAGKLRTKANSHKHRARIKGTGGSWTGKQWVALKAEYGGKCLGCGLAEAEVIAMGRKLVPDHIKPLSLGGANSIENLQPLCHGDGSSCNMAKSARWIDYRGGFPLEIL